MNPESPRPPRSLIGTILNGIYEIDRLIGAGGMGEVFKGHELQTGEPVAIKMLRPDVAENEAVLALFRKEASALHYLAHDAIVRYLVFTTEPTLQRPYLAMEFVEGRALAEVLEAGPLSLETATSLMRRIASGLNAAHQRGVVHRDVSPSNIIVPPEGVAHSKIIDFGIARSTTAVDADRTIIIDFKGKPSYASPEQLGMFQGDVTGKSDVYSLGLVVYHALVGKSLDMGRSQFELIERRRQVPQLDIVDVSMRPLLAKMLQPDPSLRPKMSEIENWRSGGSEIPDQSPAPVRVEELDGRIAKSSDRDSALTASERDFKAWRDPVVEHIEELTSSDFGPGSNHSRVRERLTKLGKLLPGEISEVKGNQFKIGYEIDRFDALMTAYRTGGEDMPVLNAAQLEDLEHLRVALKMGIEKLERWLEFRKQANESTTGEAEANREVVGETLEKMAAVMEQRPQYFHPELPATFRFLSESIRDPAGATKTAVYGAVKSVENLISFLGQRALGVGKKGADAVESHISKAVAASLVTGLGGAALQLSGALPQGWTWLKPLLAALGVVG